MSGFFHLPERLAPQKMEILRRSRRVCDLHVVFSRELQKTLESCRGMLRAGALVGVGQKERDGGGRIPLLFRAREVLVDDDLRAVVEVAVLRLPHHKRSGIGQSVAVFEGHRGEFAERRIDHFDSGAEAVERAIRLSGLLIDPDDVALAEGAPFAILAR